MASNAYKILEPEAITNIDTNPSFETGVTGVTDGAGSGSRVATEQRRGVYSYEYTPSSASDDGLYKSFSLTNNESYTASLDFKGVNGVTYQVYWANNSGTLKGTATEFTGNDRWQRVTVTFTADATATFRLYAAKNGHASTAAFYVDGFLVWNGDHDSSYVDGDQEGFITGGYQWLGTPHASQSKRLLQERSGGRERDLNDNGLLVRTPEGFGFPPVAHHTQSLALLPGAAYVGYKVLPRELKLVGSFTGTQSDPDSLHEKRKNIIDLIKPDLSRGAQPFILRYYHDDDGNGTRMVQGKFVYNLGLEMMTSKAIENVSISIIGYDPLLYEDGEEGASLSTDQTLTINDIVAYEDGAWNNMNGGFNGSVYRVVRLKNGNIIAGGAFTTGNGATATTLNYIGQYDGSSWSTFGGTSCNGDVWAIHEAPNGDIYIGGNFTVAPDGTSATRIAKSTDGGSTWSALGTGMNGIVYDIVVIDGTPYAVGAFTTGNGVTLNYIGKWTGSTFATVGGTSCNGNVLTIALKPGGSLYIGGDFTTAPDGTSATRVAKAASPYTTWSALGSGISATVESIAFGPNGAPHIASNNAASDAIFWKWDGDQWVSLGIEDNRAHAYDLKFDNRGWLHGAGSIYVPSDINNAYYLHNGYSWVNPSAHFLVDGGGNWTRIHSVEVHEENVYLGGIKGTTDETVAQVTTVTNNGTSVAYPVLKIERSGGTSARIFNLKNQTTGKTIWFEHALVDGEELVVDFRPGSRKVYSNYSGTRWNSILKSSELTEFYLAPGDNDIELYVYEVGSPTVTATMWWSITHWSADGAAA